MAAINPTTPVADTVHGQQVKKGGQMLVLEFAASGSDTWQAPKGINPHAVAWQPDTSADWVAVTMHATTKVVTFSTDGVTDPHNGKLILFYGGAS